MVCVDRQDLKKSVSFQPLWVVKETQNKHSVPRSGRELPGITWVRTKGISRPAWGPLTKQPMGQRPFQQTPVQPDYSRDPRHPLSHPNPTL